MDAKAAELYAGGRIFERLQVMLMSADGGDVLERGPVYDCGPSLEDGLFYVWRRADDGTRTLIGGRFDTKDEAYKWAKGLITPANPRIIRTPAF